MLFACGSGPGSKGVLRVALHDTLSVQVRLPADYDSTRIYPILIGLHGRGGRAEWLLKQWKRISTHNVIYIVPEAPYAFEHGFAWFRNQPYDSMRIAQDRNYSEELVEAVAMAALARFGGGKAYLLGFSQGGNLTYHASLRYRDLFQGIITFGTYLDIRTLTPEKRKGAKGLKAFIVHGKWDREIKFSDGQDAYQYLQYLGCHAKFRKTPGGHVLDGESLSLALDWMLHDEIF